MIVAASALAGVALGVAYLATLERNVQVFGAGRVFAAVALQLVRFAVVAAAFSAIAFLGVTPLIASLGGFVAARAWVLRRRR
jgi:F1F0 ATPase subunit 2